MYNITKKKIEKYNKIKKNQKGIIPYHHKKGYLNTIGTIALKMKKSLIKTSKNIKDLKLYITKSFISYKKVEKDNKSIITSLIKKN